MVLAREDFDIWYHLGLSYDLRGDFVQAVRAEAYRNSLQP
jgi:hypothetical protein